MTINIAIEQLLEVEQTRGQSGNYHLLAVFLLGFWFCIMDSLFIFVLTFKFGNMDGEINSKNKVICNLMLNIEMTTNF